MKDELFKLRFYIKDDKYWFTADYCFATEADAAKAFKELKSKYDFYDASIICKDAFSSKIYWSRKLKKED